MPQTTLDDAVIEADEPAAPPADTTLDDLSVEGEEEVASGGVVMHTPNGSLSIDPHQTEWTPAQRTALQAISIVTDGPNAVPVPNVMHFLHICQVRGLDPFIREAYLITHGKIEVDKKTGKPVDKRKFTTVTGIDGFRGIGESSGGYRGQSEPEWCGEDGVWRPVWSQARSGPPVAARVGIYRAGFDHPVYGVAMFEEYVPLVDEWVDQVDNQGRKVWENGRPKSRRTGEKVPTEMWLKMPANQLAKCAEAAAWRKAFPRRFAGLYEESEMDKARAQVTEQERAEEETQSRAARAAARAKSATARAVPASPSRVIEGTVVETGPVAEDPGKPMAQAVQEAVAQVQATSGARPEDADYLRAEILAMAKVFDRTVAVLTKREEGIWGKPFADWTPEQLLTAVQRYRPHVIKHMRDTGWGEPDAYDTVPDEDAIVNLAEVGYPTVG